MDNADYKYNALDLSDTGLWKLISVVSTSGMRGWLRHTEQKSAAPIGLFDTQWPVDDTPLLKKIENTVYDNPRMLDDYATEIILTTPRTLIIPSAILDEDEGKVENLYLQIFDVQPDDIFYDRCGDETIVYSLAAGLPAFIRRTIPGARVKNHLSILIDRFRNQSSELHRIYVDIREKESDIIAFKGKKLLSASSQIWNATSDIAYNVVRLMKAYTIGKEDAEIRISGIPDNKTELAEILRKMVDYVVFTPEPAATQSAAMPLAAALEADK